MAAKGVRNQVLTDSTDFSADLSAKEPSTSQTMSQHKVSDVYTVPEEVCEQPPNQSKNIHQTNSKFPSLRSAGIVQKITCSSRPVSAM